MSTKKDRILSNMKESTIDPKDLRPVNRLGPDDTYFLLGFVTTQTMSTLVVTNTRLLASNNSSEGSCLARHDGKGIMCHTR